MRIHKVLITSIALATSAAPAVIAQADEKGETGEKETSLDKIPKAARDALVKEAGKDKITKVKEEKKDGKTLYEAYVTPAKGNAYEIEVDGSGKLLHKGHAD